MRAGVGIWRAARVLLIGREWLVFVIVHLNEMRRQASRQTLGRVYREFSRQKYNRYKHQFPRMRESQLVTKIIKEWEGLDAARRETLSHQYQALKFIKEEDEASSGSIKKPKTIQQDPITCTPATSNRPIPTLAIQPKVSRFDQEDSDYHKYSERQSQDQRSDRSSSPSLLVVKGNPRNAGAQNNARNNMYTHFYKFHYARLSREHPRWTSAKISKIVSLLWLKRQKNLKKANSPRIKRIFKARLVKKVSGRSFFRKIKEREGFSTDQYKEIWKRLPFESKRLFERMGGGEMDTLFRRRCEVKTVKLSSGRSSSSEPVGLSFMNNIMQ